MTSTETTSTATDSTASESVETSTAPAPVQPKTLPTVPAEFPAEVLAYFSGDGMPHFHGLMLRPMFDDLRKHGQNILRQHSADAVADEELRESPEWQSVRDRDAEFSAHLENLKAEIAKATASREAEWNAARAGIVARSNETAGINLASEGKAYEDALKILADQSDTFKVTDPKTGDVFKSWVKTFPSRESLVKGEVRKAKATGSQSDRPLLRQSFGKWALDGNVLAGTTYGEVSREQKLAGSITPEYLRAGLADRNLQSVSWETIRDAAQNGTVPEDGYSFRALVSGTEHTFTCWPISRTERKADNAASDSDADSDAPVTESETGPSDADLDAIVADEA
jgi:hypothetical protein